MVIKPAHPYPLIAAPQREAQAYASAAPLPACVSTAADLIIDCDLIDLRYHRPSSVRQPPYPPGVATLPAEKGTLIDLWI